MVVPLLLRGLREKSTATKRQAAVIIDNMSKLVDNPLDAAPFLPLLLPALETNAESIADPEARSVTETAVAQLNRLKGLAEKHAAIRGDVSKIEDLFKGFFEKESSSAVVRQAEPLGFDLALWHKVCEIGAAEMGMREAEGDGGRFGHLVLACEALGRCVAPVPLVEHLVASRLSPAADLRDGSRIATIASPK